MVVLLEGSVILFFFIQFNSIKTGFSTKFPDIDYCAFSSGSDFSSSISVVFVKFGIKTLKHEMISEFRNGYFRLYFGVNTRIIFTFDSVSIGLNSMYLKIKTIKGFEYEVKFRN
ncbi:hypothetical protein RCL_jg15081.t2 [Rhizophagus clarus]|uniref:Uncharacterized protein n=1 Tax=Rhizophagus clarus TaxID=94130 RepID=A0A8H3M7Q0_9GLOM|nr:hypothetical protein RCL_jg15081.t2 [Rhizophagus clarus]